MPHQRRDPWVHVAGRGTLKGSHAKDDFGYALKQFGLSLTESFNIWDAIHFAATNPTAPSSVMERLRVFDNEAGTYGKIADIKVHGRKAYFTAKVMEPPKAMTGVLAFDGVDFYIAPNAGAAKSMIESHTVRDGDEREPTPREVLRYYELGPYYVRLHMVKRTGTIAIGRIWGDGSFAPAITSNQNPTQLNCPGLDTIEEICADMKYGIGEKCYRMAAQSATAGLFEAYKGLKNMHGVALIYDKDGVVLGRRVEFKHGSILPALGGLRGKRKRRRR